MNTPLSKKLLSVFLACALFSPLLPAQANDESTNNQTITLEKLAYFLTPQGENVQLQPGSYQIDPLEDSLQVSPTDKKTASLELAITMDTHEQDLSEPMAVSVPGLSESDSADRHVLALFMPGGLVYEAAGTYSGIRSRDVDPQSLITDPMNIYLEKSVHFLSPDGEGLKVQPGTYTVERAEQGIRLVTPEKAEGLLLEAHPDKDEGALDTSVALSLPGDAEEEADLHYIVLMAPSGESFQALGTYSGIHQRGFFKKFAKKARGTVNRAKRTVNRVGQGAKRTTQQIGKGIKQTGQKAGRFAKKTALEAKKQAEWVAKQAAKGALIAAKAICKAGLGAAQIVAQANAKLLGPVKKWLGKNLGAPKAREAMRKAVDKIINRNREAMTRILDVGMILTDPKNSRAAKDLLRPEKMCDRPGKTVQTTFQKMIGNPMRRALGVPLVRNDSPVRSRGSFSSGYVALGGGGAKIGGGEAAARFTFDFVNKSYWFLDLAGMLKANLPGGGGNLEVGMLFKKNPVDTGGWFLTFGPGFPCKIFNEKIPEKVSCNIDFIFDLPLRFEGSILKPKWDLTSWKFFVDHFQGFGVGVGGGSYESPVDGSLKAGVGINLTNIIEKFKK